MPHAVRLHGSVNETCSCFFPCLCSRPDTARISAKIRAGVGASRCCGSSDIRRELGTGSVSTAAVWRSPNDGRYRRKVLELPRPKVRVIRSSASSSFGRR